MNAVKDIQWTYTATQYFDLGTSNDIAANLSSLAGFVGSEYCQANHYYLVVETDGTSKSVTIQKNGGNVTDYSGAITFSAAGFTEGTIMLGTMAADITNVTDKVTVAGVTADDNINGISFKGTSDALTLKVTRRADTSNVTHVITSALDSATETGYKVKVNGLEYVLTPANSKLPSLDFTVGTADSSGATNISGLTTGVKIKLPNGDNAGLMFDGVLLTSADAYMNGWQVIGTANGPAVYDTGSSTVCITTNTSDGYIASFKYGEAGNTIKVDKINPNDKGYAIVKIRAGVPSVKDLYPNSAISGVGAGQVQTMLDVGTFSVNGIKFTKKTSGEAVASTDGDNATTLTIDKDITTGTAGKKYIVGGTAYDDVSANVDLTSSYAALDAAGEYVKVGGCDKLTATSLSTGQALMIGTDGAIKPSSPYAVGDCFTLGETTYNFTKSKTDGNIKLVIKNGGQNAGAYDYPAATFATLSITDAAGKEDNLTGLPERTSTPLALTKNTFADAAEASGEDAMKTATTLYYNADGDPFLTADSATVATLTRTSASTTDSYTLKVTGKLSSEVNITDVTANLTDSGTGTTYVVDDKGTAFQVNGTASVDPSDVLASVTGVIIIKGDMKTKAAEATYDISSKDNDNNITFLAGNDIRSTKVKIWGGQVTLTESGNATDTRVSCDGSVTGLDGNATVTGVPAGKTVATTGDGRVTINGRNYTLSGSQSGITYVVASSGISGISGLTGDAVLKLEGSFFSSSLTFLDDPASPKTFTDIKSVDGIEISKGSGGYTVTLNRVDERFTSSAGITYRLKEAGSSVTVAEDGSITGLSNGTRISLTDSTGTVTMEVKDSILVIKKSDGSTLAYKQEDDSVPFGVTATGATLAKLDFKVTGQSTDSTETASMGTDPSGQAGLQIDGVGISTVTNGTYLDKNGNVTMDSSKATAEVTIADSGDEVRYEARTDRAQQLDINAGTGAANMEWDITTGKGADSINLVSSKDSVIDAGEGRNNISVGKENTGGTVIRTGSGNDTINVAGSGDALVEAAGGKNRIAHTGTGTATLKGGSGNDTISSSNEDDIIQLGDGKDILKMTSGVTNTVSDYQYGEDKLCLASTKGKLSADKIKIIEDGTISYGTDDGAVKLGEGKSFYAATLVDADGENKLNVGWTGAHGGTIDASAEKAPLVLIGNPDADGESILMGGKGKSTIISGGGHTSLWGGTGDALLIGAEDARDEFFFFGESGRDTISGFTAGTEDNSDVLNLFGSTVTGIKSTEKGVEISTSDKSKLLIQGLGVNDKIQWVSGEAKGVAKIGARNKANTFIYEDDVTNYVGGNKSDTLSVSGDSNSVWLEGIGSSIEIIDASSSMGDNILAGSRESQTIIGGWGSTSLWGGAGGNDSLVGGNGYNEFYFGMGEGKDIITNSNDDDKIMLYNVKATDLNAQATGMRHGNMVITLNDGSSLTIRDYSRQGATTFQFKDGTYTYDRSTGTWNEKK